MPSFGELITGQRAHLARGSEQLCRTQRLSARITCPLAPTLAADCASLRALQQKGTYHAGTLFPKLPNPPGTRGLRAVSINIPCPGTWMPQPASALLPRPAEPQILLYVHVKTKYSVCHAQKKQAETTGDYLPKWFVLETELSSYQAPQQPPRPGGSRYHLASTSKTQTVLQLKGWKHEI